MSHVVIEHHEDGFVIVDDEAWFLDDYAREATTCVVCGVRFMVVPDEGQTLVGQARRSCSDQCSLEAKRHAAREYMRRRRAA